MDADKLADIYALFRTGLWGQFGHPSKEMALVLLLDEVSKLRLVAKDAAILAEALKGTSVRALDDDSPCWCQHPFDRVKRADEEHDDPLCIECRAALLLYEKTEK